MANKRYSDTSPNKGDKDSCKEGIKSTSKTKPAGNPSAGSIPGPEHARGGAPVKSGGKDLKAPSFTEQKHRQPSGDLPKGI